MLISFFTFILLSWNFDLLKSGGGVGGNLGGKKKQNDPLRDVFVKHAQPVVQQQQQQGNKDDAYAQFMAEMEKMM